MTNHKWLLWILNLIWFQNNFQGVFWYLPFFFAVARYPSSFRSRWGHRILVCRSPWRKLLWRDQALTHQVRLLSPRDVNSGKRFETSVVRSVDNLRCEAAAINKDLLEFYSTIYHPARSDLWAQSASRNIGIFATVAERFSPSTTHARIRESGWVMHLFATVKVRNLRVGNSK